MRKWLAMAGCILAVWAGLAYAVPILHSERPEEPATILFVPKMRGDSFAFWEAMNQGVYTAAEEFGVKVTVAAGPVESDIDGQIRILEQAIKDKPSAIVLAATDYNRLAPVAKRIVEAGIKLVTVDSGVKDGISASFIATDNYEAAKSAAKELIRLMRGEGTVAVLSVVKGSATALERERGIRDGLAEAPGVTVLEETRFSDASEEKAYEITKELLQDEPSLGGIAALNEPTAVGAARAIREAGAQWRVQLIGFDSSPLEIGYLEDGILRAVVVQKPFNMGYLAVKTARDLLSGKKAPAVIDTGSVIITKANMYDGDKQKLLFPFVEE